jgi:membrane protein DedA with SNARE-associated domain
MLAALAGYKYLLVFGGLVFSGDIFLVGFIYSARLGFVTLPKLFLTALLASVVSDCMWYVIGRNIGSDRIARLPFMRKNPALVEKIAGLFERKGIFFLFSCKFLYGTRIITQVICGIHKMKYAKYFLVNILGSLIWILAVILIVNAVDASLATVKNTITKIEISVTLLAGFFFAMRFLSRKYLQEK